MIFDTRDRLLELMRGNEAAADFVETAVSVLHFWDDLVDRDKPLTDDVINQSMFNALVALPRNPFYRDNFAVLSTLLVNAITNWQVANRLERGDRDEYRLRIAYILRSSYVDLITQSAFIVGGMAWSVHVGEQIRLYAHKETYQGYLDNLEQELTARQAQEEA